MNISLNKSWTIHILNSNEILIRDIPFDVNLKEKRDINSLNSKEGSYFNSGKYIYTKHFNVDPKYLDNDSEIHFEGVYKKSEIYLNNELVYTNLNGFNDFYVKVRLKKENILEVRVDNSLIPNARFYTGSGIIRDVNLIIYENKKEIDYVKVSLLDYQSKLTKIDIFFLNNIEDKSYYYEIFDINKSTLLYKDNKSEIILDKLDLWDLDNPNLYLLIIYSKNDKREITFGLRKIDLIPQKGLFLNGKRIILKGCCIHSDNGILGASSFKFYETKKIEILKRNGFNAIRASHNPCSTNFIKEADRLGMLIIDEAFDGWYIPKNYHDISRIFFKVNKETLKNMVMKDINSPSVIMYSLGNEISEVATKKGIDLVKEMKDYIKSFDNERYVTLGVNLLVCVYYKLGLGVYKDKGEYKEENIVNNNKNKKKEKKNGSEFFNSIIRKLGSLMFLISKCNIAKKVANEVSKNVEVLGLNYGTPRYKIDSKKYPNRFMLGSETLVKDIKINYESSFKYPNVLGDFIWSGIDYLGEALSNGYVYYSYKGLPLLAGAGVIDFTLKENSEMEYLKTIWNKDLTPKIFVSRINHYFETPFKSAWRFSDSINSYNYQKYNGKKGYIEVYSYAPYVKLMINNKVIGIKKTKNCRTKFNIKYQEGEVKAIALNKDKKEISGSTLKSGKKMFLKVKIDKDYLDLSLNDMAFMEIEYVDENNNIYPDIEIEIKVETSENIELIALGSANLITNESFLSNTYKTYEGRLVGVIKAKNKGLGKIKIINDFENKEINLEVR